MAGARIEEDALPISPELRKLCAKHGLAVTEFALSAGEDYELLFTSADRSLAAAFRFLNQPITRIGQIVEASEGFTIRRADGAVEPVTVKGYEHFIS